MVVKGSALLKKQIQLSKLLVHNFQQLLILLDVVRNVLKSETGGHGLFPAHMVR
jgi:hypothetical protein